MNAQKEWTDAEWTAWLEAGIEGSLRTFELNDMQIASIRNVIQNDFQVEGDLRKDLAQNIKRLIDIKSYRGHRHKKGLPVRGQRTHTNARTRKGPKRRIQKKKKPLNLSVQPIKFFPFGRDCQSRYTEAT